VEREIWHRDRRQLVEVIPPRTPSGFQCIVKQECVYMVTVDIVYLLCVVYFL
jgi:hypothetical protein